MNIASENTFVKIKDVQEKYWLDSDIFYTVASSGTVSLWAADGDEAIKLGCRLPGASGKTSDRIARDMYAA